MATEVISSVGSDVGDDYSTLASWYSDKGGDLVSRDTVEIAELRGEQHSVASTHLDMSGDTTDSTRYFHIRTMSGAEFRGDFGDLTGVAVLTTSALTNGSAVIEMDQVDYTIFEDFCIKDVTLSSASNNVAKGLFAQSKGSLCKNVGVSGITVSAAPSGNVSAIGIHWSDYNGASFIRHCIVNNINATYTGTNDTKTVLSAGFHFVDNDAENCVVANITATNSTANGAVTAVGFTSQVGLVLLETA